MFKIVNKRVGIFSDVHIGLGQNSSIWHQNILDFAEWAKSFYLKENIKEIFIPGDIFHNRNEISVNTLNVAKDFFKILKDFNIFISTGNHDCYYKDRSDINSISLFNEWSNITVFDDLPQIILTPNNKKICMVPWGCRLEDIPKSDICFGHFEVASFKMNNYHTCENGINSKDLLSKSPLIISGHFHTRTHRHYNDGQIIYVGSPYQQNFGDSNGSHGIYILDLENNDIEFIENNFSPKHIKIKLSDIQNKIIDSNTLKERVPNNMISFVVDDKITPDKISLLSSKIQSLSPKFFRLEYQNPESSTLSSNQLQTYDSVDIVENIKDFVESMELESKPEIISYLTNLYTKLAS